MIKMSLIFTLRLSAYFVVVLGDRYVFNNQAPPANALTEGLSTGFINHHINIINFAAGWNACIKGPSGEHVIIFKTFPNGGTMIISSPGNGYHACCGCSNSSQRNQYRAMLNKLDFISEFSGSWTVPNEFAAFGKTVIIPDLVYKNTGTYTFTCKQGGQTMSESIEILFLCFMCASEICKHASPAIDYYYKFCGNNKKFRQCDDHGGSLNGTV